jgi:fructose transport system substrate-binding protein
MEKHPGANPDVNVVYAINEPAAAGGYQALQALGGAEDVLIVRVDGGCAGVQNVADGVIGATPSCTRSTWRASHRGHRAFAADGTLPENTEGKDFFDTGVRLVTDAPSRAWSPSRSRKAWSSAGADKA